MKFRYAPTVSLVFTAASVTVIILLALGVIQ